MNLINISNVCRELDCLSLLCLFTLGQLKHEFYLKLDKTLPYRLCYQLQRIGSIFKKKLLGLFLSLFFDCVWEPAFSPCPIFSSISLTNINELTFNDCGKEAY